MRLPWVHASHMLQGTAIFCGLVTGTRYDALPGHLSSPGALRNTCAIFGAARYMKPEPLFCVGLIIVIDIVPKNHLNGFEIGTPRPVIRHPPTVTIRAVIDIVTMLRFWPCSQP